MRPACTTVASTLTSEHGSGWHADVPEQRSGDTATNSRKRSADDSQAAKVSYKGTPQGRLMEKGNVYNDHVR